MFPRMEPRAKAIVKTLILCLVAGLFIAAAKIGYGTRTDSLAFIADGIHVLFDVGATVMGIVSVIWSSKPPDEDYPYGHYKFETISTLILALLLLTAAY